MSSELKKQNDALRAELLRLQTQAAATGVPVSSGGIDLMTGERVPAYKFLGLEFGDATPYAERRDDLLQEIGKVSGQVDAAAQERTRKSKLEDAQDFLELQKQSGIGNVRDVTDAMVDFRYRTRDLDRQEADEAMNRSILQSQRQLAAVMPYLDEAGRKATERNLNASQRFLDFKERMPTAIQNRMLMSSSAFAQNLQAVATAANAAANMARSGTNRSFGR